MAERILPTCAELREAFNYDPDTGILTLKGRRYNNGKLATYVNRQGRNMVTLRKRHMVAARVIWCLITGDWPPSDIQIDHIDRERLNEKWSNLRLASNGENKQNQLIQRNNTSGFKGVHFNKRQGLWTAHIQANKIKHFLGGFDSAEKAAEAYRQAALRFHGKFAAF